MRKVLSATLMFVLSLNLLAQNTKDLKKVMELQIYGEGGANGACVAWHPAQKKYYAAMAGNVSLSKN